MIGLAEVERAAAALAGVVLRTPLVDASSWAPTSPGRCGLALKAEHRQPVGAFKVRGAYYAVARLDPSARARGLITHSSGNHAQAVAWAARAFGVPATVVMPDDATVAKVAATRALGATVVTVPVTQRVPAAQQIAERTGAALIPPFDHVDVIAAQGTVGLEIVQDAPDVDLVLVPVGGGGLIAGVAVAVRALRPGAVVIGVEPELAADAAESLHAGERRCWPAADTARTTADGLRATSLGELTWPHVRTLVHDIVTVTEAQIADAVRVLHDRAGITAEPSGAVATAGWFSHRDTLPPGRAVAVVSGGNVEPAYLAAALAGRDA